VSSGKRRASPAFPRFKEANHRRKASKQAAKQHLKQHLKIARQREDHAHKTARKYVDAYAFIHILTLKAENAGARVVEVSPHLTS
jgi:transposase